MQGIELTLIVDQSARVSAIFSMQKLVGYRHFFDTGNCGSIACPVIG